MPLRGMSYILAKNNVFRRLLSHDKSHSKSHHKNLSSTDLADRV